MISWTWPQKNTWTTFLDSDSFCDILELDLKSAQTTLLDFDWFLEYTGLGVKKTLGLTYWDEFIITKQGCCLKSVKTSLNYLLSS